MLVQASGFEVSGFGEIYTRVKKTLQGHLISNMFFQICAGIPLEYIHGSIRILILYNSGVIVGSISGFGQILTHGDTLNSWAS